MGPNGSGKSTLSLAIMGHPRYKIVKGTVTFEGKDVLKMMPDERARAGIFLAFQYPQAIAGVSVANFLRTTLNARRRAANPGADEKTTQIPLPQFRKLVQMDEGVISRHVNEGFSGGEKKRLEMLQMHVLQPRLAVLDETDSGLDIDALKTVAESINALRGPDVGILLITHYERILKFVMPDFVHVLVDGRIVRTGGKELAHELEQKGYDWIRDALYAGKV